MLTERLENLIWQGKAKYETLPIGTPAAGVDVKDNETVIVIGFDYFDFIDVEEGTQWNVDIENFMRQINKQIVLSSPNRREVFLFRSQVNFNLNALNQPNRPVPAESSKHYNCYLPFTENFTINIATIPSPDEWGGTIIGAAPNATRQKAVPLAYGTVDTDNEPTRLVTGFYADSEARAFKSVPVALGAPGTSFNDWQVKLDNDTAILEPIDDFWGGFTYPCLNVHLVRINKRLEAKFI